MTIFQALILGIVQGLSEFLPISSSGHLILVPYLFHWGQIDNKLSFDIALHFGTALAVLGYFWKDWWEMAKSLTKPKSEKAKLFYLLMIGSVPVGIIGIILEKLVEDVFRTPLITAVMLVVFSLVLWFADRIRNNTKTLKDLTAKDSILIGLSQIIALLPGVSRSGITISASLLRSLNREQAARFSFLLSTPVILGASTAKGLDFVRGTIPQSEYLPFLVGVATSGLVGYLTIKFLLKYIQTHSFKVFIVYRLVLAAIIFLFLLFGY